MSRHREASTLLGDGRRRGQCQPTGLPLFWSLAGIAGSDGLIMPIENEGRMRARWRKDGA